MARECNPAGNLTRTRRASHRRRQRATSTLSRLNAHRYSIHPGASRVSAGTPLGPDLTDTKWHWSDGSFAGIAKTITSGVSQSKKYRSPMPPVGGAQLTLDQVSAVAAYIWGLNHH
jgi:hypothetical protein